MAHQENSPKSSAGQPGVDLVMNRKHVVDKHCEKKGLSEVEVVALGKIRPHGELALLIRDAVHHIVSNNT